MYLCPVFNNMIGFNMLNLVDNIILYIPVKQFDVLLGLENSEKVSAFLASTLRGGFGYTLRSLVCATRNCSCANCMLKRTCVYCFLFESIPPENAPRLNKYKAIPRPFIIRPSQNGAVVDIKLVLVGQAVTYLPYFIYTFNKLGEKGLGAGRIKFTVEKVSIAGKQIYPVNNGDVDTVFPSDSIEIMPGEKRNGSVKLDFLTPLVIRKNDETLSSMDGRTFISTLLRRITNLNAFYGKTPDMEIDPVPYLSAAETLFSTWNLVPEKHSRFSTRQQSRLDYSGFTGTVILKGDIGTLMPLLKAGEIFSVGKNTVFGYGQYEMEEI
jgi:CRISPR-associated endoribonuclease Cas6